MKRDILITKASGEKSTFSEKHVRNSLIRAGATPAQIEHILSDIDIALYDGISTKKIYDLAFSLLRNQTPHIAARYHLKQAIMELGPSGFPFEKFISEILIHQGYITKVGEILQGQCVNHEIDVIAEKEGHYHMIECKYHNIQGIFCDVKVPLYIHARFIDVENNRSKISVPLDHLFKGWIVTNTRFSTDAIKYGNCAGLKLIGWDYPLKGSLKEQIDALGLYPLTCLTTLTKTEKQFLLNQQIVLCKDVLMNEKKLKNAGMSTDRIKNTMQEANKLCERLIQTNQTK